MTSENTNNEMRRVYIIGNGFDLHHGIMSTYWNFRDYLVVNEGEVLKTLELFNFNESELWSDFEQNLADLDEDLMYEYYSDSLVSYADDNWTKEDFILRSYSDDSEMKINSDEIISDVETLIDEKYFKSN